jgi:hypothetical protein
MVCEELGVPIAWLLDAAEQGVVPPPVIYNGELIWDRDTVVQAMRGQASIPGMFPAMPPGYDRVRELRSWRKNVSHGVPRFVRCNPMSRRPTDANRRRPK